MVAFRVIHRTLQFHAVDKSGTVERSGEKTAIKKGKILLFMKSAQQSAQKFVERASAASGDYVSGAQQTTKDQSALAIAAAPIYAQAVQAAITRGSFAKGLQKSGKAGWLAGVTTKGGERFAGGVAASSQSYASNSSRYDGARGAAAALPRGLKGSATNLARVTAVVNALRTAKTGTSA